MSTKKHCNKCGRLLPKAEFYKRASSPDGLNHYCKSCVKKRQKKDKKKYKKKISIKMREWHLKKNYSMTLEDYDNMFEDQGGVCFICKQPETLNQRLCVDHSHKTGQVRKLLCNQCNRVLGYTKENVSLLKDFIKYIERLG